MLAELAFSDVTLYRDPVSVLATMILPTPVLPSQIPSTQIRLYQLRYVASIKMVRGGFLKPLLKNLSTRRDVGVLLSIAATLPNASGLKKFVVL